MSDVKYDPELCERLLCDVAIVRQDMYAQGVEEDQRLISDLADQLEAARREMERLTSQRFSVTDGVALRAAIMREVAKETNRELDPIAYLAIANRVAEQCAPLIDTYRAAKGKAGT